MSEDPYLDSLPWYFHCPEGHELSDSKPYYTELPFKNTRQCYTLEGKLCVVYMEGPEKKAVWCRSDPVRYYPMSAWALEWGDLAKVCYARPIHEVSFALQHDLRLQESKDEAAKG